MRIRLQTLLLTAILSPTLLLGGPLRAINKAKLRAYKAAHVAGYAERAAFFRGPTKAELAKFAGTGRVPISNIHSFQLGEELIQYQAFRGDLGHELRVVGRRLPRDEGYVIFSPPKAPGKSLFIHNQKGLRDIPGVGHELKETLLNFYPNAIQESEMGGVNRVLMKLAIQEGDAAKLARIPAIRGYGRNFDFVNNGIAADGSGHFMLRLFPGTGTESMIGPAFHQIPEVMEWARHLDLLDQRFMDAARSIFSRL